MATAKKFDVKYGISVNGLSFVDENRNITVNDLTVRGVSTIVDTRSITTIDPIITLGESGSQYTSTGVSGNKILFPAEAFADIAIGDAIVYDAGDLTYDDGLGGGPASVATGTVYYVASRDADPTSPTFRCIGLELIQGNGELAGTFASSSGSNTWTLNPLRDLNQDLGVAFNYVDGTPQLGFFGYRDSTQDFTFLLGSSYSGSDLQSDSASPVFENGEKGGIDVRNIKLEPTVALTSSLPGVDINQTWDDGTVSFKAFTIDVVDTNSNSASTLIDVTVGSDRKLSLRKDGSLAINSSTYNGALTIAGTTEPVLVYGSASWTNSGTVYKGIDVNITGTAFDPTSTLLTLSTSASRAFEINAYGNITSLVEFTSGNLETALKVDVTNTSSAADSLLLDLQVGSSSKFSVDVDGDVTVAGSIGVSGGLTVEGAGTFNDNIDLKASVSGTYETNSRTQSEYVEIAAGANTATQIAAFASSDFTTAKYLVQLKQGGITHSTEVLLIHDGSTAYITEYGALYNTEIIGTLDAAVSGGDVILTVTPTASIVANSAIIEARVVTVSISA